MSTRRSLAFAFLDRYASLLIGVASSMVLARVLTPGEVGVYSVTMALLALVSTVRDVGAGQYLLQEPNLTRDRIRAVWCVQLGVGLILGALVVVASTPVAAFYREPRMRDIMLLLALNYVVNPFGSVTYAWLMREMRYDAIAIIRFSASVATAVTSIGLAMRGWGPISLALGSLCGTVVNALTSVAFRPSGYPWMPGVREVGSWLVFTRQWPGGHVPSARDRRGVFSDPLPVCARCTRAACIGAILPDRFHLCDRPERLFRGRARLPRRSRNTFAVRSPVGSVG